MSIKDYFLLIYTFMCMIIFLTFQSVTKPAFLARVWEWLGIGKDCPAILKYHVKQGIGRKKEEIHSFMRIPKNGKK